MLLPLAIMFAAMTTATSAPAETQNAQVASTRLHGEQSREAVAFCRAYAWGWLAHADMESGLLPRRLTGEQYWNARDCAADNFPFLWLTAHVLDDVYLKRAAANIFRQEQLLTKRVGELPDTYDFASQTWLEPEIDMREIIFGASEYAKDGLMPITEWLGIGTWEERMEGLVRGVWAHADHETEAGLLPSDDVEVNGELLQTMARLYWMTGDESFKTWTYRIADHYFVHDPPAEWRRIRLRDHGCEIIGGLSEAYFLASYEDPEKLETWRPPMRALLDLILEKGVNADGLMPTWFEPDRGKADYENMSDNWGYVYDAFLTVAHVDDVAAYFDAVEHALSKLPKYVDTAWEGRGGADGYADAIEGGINLLNRIPVEAGFQWADDSMAILLDKQRPDGIIEGWYGDGNSARTALMYALMKTQGVAPSPWRGDVRAGAVMENGTLIFTISADWAWRGTLRFDKPRHRMVLNLPHDYPRINQFPEWFTAEPGARYRVSIGGAPPQDFPAEALWSFPLELEPGQEKTITVNVDSALAK